MAISANSNNGPTRPTVTLSQVSEWFICNGIWQQASYNRNWIMLLRNHSFIHSFVYWLTLKFISNQYLTCFRPITRLRICQLRTDKWCRQGNQHFKRPPTAKQDYQGKPSQWNNVPSLVQLTNRPLERQINKNLIILHFVSNYFWHGHFDHAWCISIRCSPAVVFFPELN